MPFKLDSLTSHILDLSCFYITNTGYLPSPSLHPCKSVTITFLSPLKKFVILQNILHQYVVGIFGFIVVTYHLHFLLFLGPLD